MLSPWRATGGLAQACKQLRRFDGLPIYRFEATTASFCRPMNRGILPCSRRVTPVRRYATTLAAPLNETVAAEDTVHIQKSKKKRKPAARKSLAKIALEAERSQDKGVPMETVPSSGLPSTEKVVKAYCVAEEYDMIKAEKLLQSQYKIDPCGTMLDPEDPPVLHIELPARNARSSSANLEDSAQGDVFIFPSGNLVAWNVPEETITYLARTLAPAAENSLGERSEEEDMTYIEDTTRERSSIRGDTIVLGIKSTPSGSNSPQPMDLALTKIAFSSGLARSAKLAVIEESLSDYFESTRSLPKTLSQGTLRSFSRAFVYRKLGQLLDLRAQLNLYSEITDSLPDLFWDTRLELGLESYYDQVSKALDAGIRIKTLNEKMDYAQEIAGVLKEKLSEKNSSRLEWIIIILIAVEVGHVFWQHYGGFEKPDHRNAKENA